MVASVESGRKRQIDGDVLAGSNLSALPGLIV